jgi:hypothetical protein
MSDVETKTEWSHLLGKGMAGKLKGRKLKPIITDMVTWSVWKKQHPDTTVLDMSRTSREYSSLFYRDPDRFVFGFEVDGQACILPMTGMMENPVHQFSVGSTALLATFDRDGAVTHLFERQMEGRVLNFEQVDDLTMKDQQTGSRWNRLSGTYIEGDLHGKMLKQRVGIMSFRRAWQNFHPDSQKIGF